MVNILLVAAVIALGIAISVDYIEHNKIKEAMYNGKHRYK